MGDLAALVRGVMDDLSTAGILADYIEEQGDPRGVLLRRRWRRWQRAIHYSAEYDRRSIELGFGTAAYSGSRPSDLVKHANRVDRDHYIFRWYVERRFIHGIAR